MSEARAQALMEELARAYPPSSGLSVARPDWSGVLGDGAAPPRVGASSRGSVAAQLRAAVAGGLPATLPTASTRARAGRDPAGPTRCAAGDTRITDLLDVRRLRDVCRIHHGFLGSYEAVADVPQRGVEPSSLEDMARDYLPEWFDEVLNHRTRMSVGERVVLSSSWGDLGFAGLTFDHMFRDVAALAVAQLAAHSHDFVPPDQFRKRCSYSKGWQQQKLYTPGRFYVAGCVDAWTCLVQLGLRGGLEGMAFAVSSSGEVSVTREVTEAFALTIDPHQVDPLSLLPGYVLLTAGMAVQALITDFYWYMARRYHADWVARGRPSLDAGNIVGWLCALSGLTELTDFAAIIYHEMGHLWPGAYWHCRLTFPVVQRNNCCHYVGQLMYEHWAMAKWGLPSPLLPFGAMRSRGLSNTRFGGAGASGEEWGGPAEFMAGDLCDGGKVDITHEGLFARERSVRVAWDLGATAQCTRRGADEVGHHTWIFR